VSITNITVTGALKGTGGSAASGTVQFQLSASITDGSSTVVSSDPFTVALSNTGTFSIGLPANNDSTTLPQGTFYTVTFDVNGVVWSENIVIPHTPSTVDISTIVPLGGNVVTSPFAYLVSLIQTYAGTSGGTGGGGGGGGGGSTGAIGGTP
jgi:hypothetical protein